MRRPIDRTRCLVCGRPYTEHTPAELASGCKQKVSQT